MKGRKRLLSLVLAVVLLCVSAGSALAAVDVYDEQGNQKSKDHATVTDAANYKGNDTSKNVSSDAVTKDGDRLVVRDTYDETTNTVTHTEWGDDPIENSVTITGEDGGLNDAGQQSGNATIVMGEENKETDIQLGDPVTDENAEKIKVTIEDVNLEANGDVDIFANGNSLTIENGVQTNIDLDDDTQTDTLDLYGGTQADENGKSEDVASTEMEIKSGTYNTVVAGSEGDGNIRGGT